ncbi:MAG: hypothetical protein N2515_09285, partial [Deltaproteobacteria bacterium]|nr:hypothetical protein [Deltaproteobacteria bacterium]
MACGGESSRIESRFFTLHNAMAAMGMAQSGPVIQGKLAQGEEARVNLEVQPRSCLVFAAIGSSDVTNIDVIIQNENGQEIARDENASNQAVVRWCVNRPIRAQAIIRMVQGSGSYIAGVWASTSGSHRAHSPTTTTIGPAKVQTGIERSEQGTCTSPWPLRPGEKRRGST